MQSNASSRRIKILLIPVFVVIIFSGLGIYAFSLLQSNQMGLRNLDVGILQQKSAILEFQFYLQDTITDLYQMTATASTEADKSKLKDLQQKNLKEIAALAAEYPEAETAMAKVNISPEKIAAFRTLMDNYIKTSKSVINMVDTDAATAMAWMTPVQKQFSELDELTDDISQQLKAQQKLRVGQLESDMEKGRIIFIVITLVISLLAMMLSTVLGRFMSALETLHASTNAMLEGLGQGLLFFDEKGMCAPIYSKSCLDLLECNPSRMHIGDVLKLTPENRNTLHAVLEMMFGGKTAMSFYELAALAPALYKHSEGLHVSLHYRPIMSAGGQLRNILLVATDRTKEKKAEKMLKEVETAATRTIRIARSRNYLLRFFYNFEACIAVPIPLANADSLEQIRRDIHTLKGMASMFQFVELAHVLHRLEIEMPRDTPDPESVMSKFRPRLMKLFQESKDYAREILGEDFQSSGKIRVIPQAQLYAFANLLQASFSAGTANQQLCQAYFKDVLAVPLWQLFDDFVVTLQEISDRLGKPVNPCLFIGENFFISPEIYESLFASFVHIARNIADHGIEPASVRKERAKDPKATITICTERIKKDSSDWFFIEFIDDGGGVDVAALRKKLKEEQQQQTNLDQLDDHAVMQRLFDDGMSTMETATLHSGQGIGLNAVKTEVARLGGLVTISSKPGLGVSLRIELPFGQYFFK